MKIKEAMPRLLTTGGIFNRLNIPGYDPIKMGLYYRFHSGNKEASDLVKEFTNDGEITVAGEHAIGDMIANLYLPQWLKINEVLTKEYDPFENYSRNENWTQTDSGTDTKTNVIGEREKIEDLGESTDTTNYGQDKMTDVVGNKSITDNIGARSDSTTYGTDSTTKNFGAKSGTNSDKISGFNSSSYVNSTQSTDSEQAYTDSETRQSRTDNESIGEQSNTHTEASYTDTHTKDAKVDSTQHGAKTNIITETESTDTYSTSYGKQTTYQNNTHGNIGWFTGGDIINKELEARQNILMERIAKDIDSILTIPIYFWD